MLLTMIDKYAVIWVLGLSLVLHFHATISSRNLQASHQYVGRKLAATNHPGFVSIDCGASVEYTDEDTGIFYQTDDRFIDTGTNQVLPSSVFLAREQLRTLRSFPEGKKNCYTLKPEQGKNNVYMIRALFLYGNYDGKNQTPTFDIYVGVSSWLTLSVVPGENWCEITYVPSTNYISFCLVNINRGVPIISALELRHLPTGIYQVGSDAIEVFRRFDTGSPTDSLVRYKGDAYDRTWQSQKFPDDTFKSWNLLNTTSTIDVANSDNLYKPPPEMLQTVGQGLNASSSLDYYLNPGGTGNLFYIYFHFAEIEKLPTGKKREMFISFNGSYLQEPFTIDYLKPQTVGPIKLPYLGDQIHFSIRSTNESGLPPILNGFEIFRAFELKGTPTNSEDFDAIMDIKGAYQVSRNWQGDPCVDSSWEGLNCSLSNSPRIISLNLTSSRLKGNVAASISNLTSLQILDLSYNGLTGSLPEFLAELPSLEVINLAGNDFTGSVPKSLTEKAASGTLLLSLDGNTRLCVSGSCETKPTKKLPVISIVIAVSVLVVLLLAALAIWWKWKRSATGTNEADEETLKSKKHEFTHRQVVNMTDNFKTVVGVGGFGNVYLGTLSSGLKVAVKMLSPDSDQGPREFLQEVKLLMRVHHGNVVSLVGYCSHPKNMALIYEYMPNGNLRQRLAGLDTGSMLSWKDRVQIAVQAAQGLEYLHNGCKPPIIHRDLKTANILLDENMQAKLADFGLSRAFQDEDVTHISTTNAVGTPGYIDPMCIGLAQFSKSSDVFSFGVILMELVTAKPAIARGTETAVHLLDWVLPQFERGDIRNIVDQRLGGNFSIDSAWKLVEIAILCLQESPYQRPEMSEVLSELKQCLAAERLRSESASLGKRSSMSLQDNSLEFGVMDTSEMSRPSAR